MNRLIKKILILLITVGLGLFVSIIVILWTYSNKLPDYKFLKNYKPSVSSKLYSGGGELVSDFSTEKRIFVPYNTIPKKVIHAFLSAEDKNFFSHPGVDAKGIIRAVLRNISNIIYEKRLEGASTITQQVAKNFLLSNEVSLNRKIKEAILAFRIERALSKERILELYLNQIYLGQGAYGIASASLEYFDKPISKLDYAEASLLAALPKAPSKYNPFKNIDLAKYRRDLVIKNLYDNSYISYKKYKKLLNTKIILKKRKKIYLEDARYYVEDVRKFIVEKYGFDKVYKQGFNIKTPINLEIQTIATQSLRDGLIQYDKRKGWRGPLLNKKDTNNWNNDLKKYHLEKSIGWNLAIIKKINKFFVEIETDQKIAGKIEYQDVSWTKKELDKLFKVGDVVYVNKIKDNIFSLKQLPKANGGIVVMDPFTGRVIAMSGGFSFKRSEFNRATQASRQPGSAFKPFIYITAMKEGYTPATLILDAPYVVDQGPGLPKWKPSNYTDKFYGLSPMRTGVEKSRNLMTIRLSDKIGMEKILDTATDFKIGKYMNNNLSMSLGSGLVTLLDLTNAYAMIVNGGKEINPSLITSVYDKTGKQILINEIKKCNLCNQINSEIDYSIPDIINNQQSVLDPRIAYQITSMLEGVILRGTGRRIKELDTPLGGKTGTTNDNKDAWFVGFSPDLAVGVYVGFDQPKSLGYKQTGSAVAVPIFKDFMKEAKVNPSKIPFRVPSGISFVKIDPKTGLVSKISEGIFEPFIIGTEPYNQSRLKKLDNLGTINNNSISGTGSLLSN